MVALELTLRYALQLLARRVKRVVWPNSYRFSNYTGRHHLKPEMSPEFRAWEILYRERLEHSVWIIVTPC
jgi:hypothetical protein